MEKFRAHKATIILVLAVILLLVGGVVAFQKFTSNKNQSEGGEEVELSFDAEGPYALMVPRKDGNAAILNLKRTSSYDSISYELAYNAEGIDRGVVGTLDTNQKKGEYEQEILFGTCSKNVCKYDIGVENGTLTLHIVKGSEKFRINTSWHLQKIDLTEGNIVSGDNHFMLKSTASEEELANVGFSIVNELSGVPKLPDKKQVYGKVYAVNIPGAKELKGGEVTIELAKSPDGDAKIGFFAPNANEWKLLDTQKEGDTLKATTDGVGIFTVLVNSK